jgi:thiol peroxidase
MKPCLVLLSVILAAVAGCALTPDMPPVEFDAAKPGTAVSFKGTRHLLLGNPLNKGESLPHTALVDYTTMKSVDLTAFKGNVLFLSIVPSLHTSVCEAQTHYLAEEGKQMPASVKRFVISRDTPFAQKWFARESGIKGPTYLSDYKQGDFGRATGLLVDDLMLLARSVIVVDRKGVVRYIQIVPEMTKLPHMEKAFAEAEALAAEGK